MYIRLRDIRSRDAQWMRHDLRRPREHKRRERKPAVEKTSPALVAEGQRVFRFDTFGDEQLWTNTLRLHEVVEKSVDPGSHPRSHRRSAA
jgi:hypothetical protein